MENYEYVDLNTLDKVFIKSKRGIYFLYKEDELVYIGMTTNFSSRLNSHIADDTKEFDSYRFLDVNDNVNLNNIEEKYIRKYKPLYNVRFTEKQFNIYSYETCDVFKDFNLLEPNQYDIK